MWNLSGDNCRMDGIRPSFTVRLVKSTFYCNRVRIIYLGCSDSIAVHTQSKQKYISEKISIEIHLYLSNNQSNIKTIIAKRETRVYMLATSTKIKVSLLKSAGLWYFGQTKFCVSIYGNKLDKSPWYMHWPDVKMYS